MDRMSSPVDGFTRVERACASGHRGSFSSDERTDNGRQGCRLGQVFNGHVITSSCVLVRTEWTTRSHRPETSRTVLEMIFVARFLSPLREREREVRVVFGSLNGDQVELKELKTPGAWTRSKSFVHDSDDSIADRNWNLSLEAR